MKECVETTNISKIVCRENRSEVVFVNRKRDSVLRVVVDGCYIDSGKACDYLISYGGVNYYVELKGKDIEAALEQICASIRKVNHEFGSCHCVAVIISTRFPLVSGFQKAWAKISKDGALKLNDYILKNRKHMIELT